MPIGCQSRCVYLVMVDLLVAFDAIHHATIIRRLESDIELSGKLLQWITSYLENRKQKDSVLYFRTRQYPLCHAVRHMDQCLVPSCLLFPQLLFAIGHLSPTKSESDDVYFTHDSQFCTFFDWATPFTHMQRAISISTDSKIDKCMYVFGSG